jgi:hypothetical protein
MLQRVRDLFRINQRMSTARDWFESATSLKKQLENGLTV